GFGGGGGGWTGSDIDPVVEAPARIADARPDFTDTETREQSLLNFGFAVAIAVGQEDDVRGADGDDAVPGRDHAVTRREMIGEDGHTVISAVAFRGLEQLDRPVSFRGRTVLRGFGGGNAADGFVEHGGLI